MLAVPFHFMFYVLLPLLISRFTWSFLLMQVPKQLLKSRGFHEECIHSAMELLLAHFAQWSYHISFPEVATIPLILLKRFHEKTSLESLRRSVKRLIDQVLVKRKIGALKLKKRKEKNRRTPDPKFGNLNQESSIYFWEEKILKSLRMSIF